MLGLASLRAQEQLQCAHQDLQQGKSGKYRQLDRGAGATVQRLQLLPASAEPTREHLVEPEDVENKERNGYCVNEPTAEWSDLQQECSRSSLVWC